jgi:hypothetical protein
MVALAPCLDAPPRYRHFTIPDNAKSGLESIGGRISASHVSHFAFHLKADPGTPPQWPDTPSLNVAVACRLQTAAAAMAPVCAAVAYSRQGDLSVTRAQILLIDELGYLPLDERGAVLLFRSSPNPTNTTRSNPFQGRPRIFAGDATMPSALLDRLLHHTQSVLIEGDSHVVID